jgi:hypothetical protein
METMVRWLLVIALSGCSLTLSGPDPDRPRNKAPTCDTRKGAVVGDGVLGTTLALTGIGIATNDGGDSAVVPLLLGAAFLASAVHGNGVVDDCRVEVAAFDAQHGGDVEMSALDRQELIRQQKLDRRESGAPGSGGPEVRRSGDLNSSTVPNPGPVPNPGLGPTPNPGPAPAPPSGPPSPPVPPKPEARSPKPAAPAAPDWSAFWREVP